MQPSKLEVMLRAVNLGSINKAAKEMGYFQSGLTHMINKLEAEIGFPILKRDFNGISFTQKGEMLEPLIRSLVEKEIALHAKVDEMNRYNMDTIRIGAYPSTAHYLLPAIIRGFQDENPGASIEIKIGGAEIQDWLENGKIDIAFAGQELMGSGEWIPIWDDQLYAVVPASLHITNEVMPLETLAENTILIPSLNEKCAATSMLMNMDCKRKLLVAAYDSTLFSIIGRGLGVTILSKLYMKDCPDTVRMIPTTPPLFRTLGIILKSFESMNPLLEEFISCLEEHKQQH